MIKEDFVQHSLEIYFTKCGFKCIHEIHGVDLYAERPGEDKTLGLWKQREKRPM